MGTTLHAFKAHRCSFHPDRQDPYLRLGTITVFVRDQNQSLQFYLDQLGFRLAFDALNESGDRWLAVSPTDGTALLVLATPKPDSEEHKLIGRPPGIAFFTDDCSPNTGNGAIVGSVFIMSPAHAAVEKYRRLSRM